MENIGEKMGKKKFWSVFGWVGRMKNKWWGPCIFSPGLSKSFLSKIKRKLKREIVHHFWIKMPLYNCTFTHAAFLHIFFHLFFFLFFLFTGQACLVYIYIYTFFFSLGVIFYLFYGYDFYFLINSGD